MKKVYLTEQAQKDLKGIASVERFKIRKKLTALIYDSVSGKKLTGKLTGFYSVRVWPYRIIYILNKNEMWIVHVKHRKEAYK